MKNKTKKVNWEKWLFILGMLIAVVGLIDMVSADHSLVHTYQQSQETLAETKTIETIGSGLRTQYGFDGTKCVKRSLMSLPRKTNPNGVFPATWFLTHRVFESEGIVYAYRIFPSKRTSPFEKIEGHPFGGRRLREVVCDRIKIDTTPLPLSWWRNSHDPSRYFQIQSNGFPHEIPFFNQIK